MENMTKIAIEYVPVDQLIPYDKNPRRNDAAIPKVAASIREFGFKVPMVIDENNVVVTGHTRLLAVKKLTADGELPEGMEDGIPCIRAKDLTPEQIRAFRLADNKVSEFAEWDLSMLGDELNALPEFDFGELGFEEADFKIDKGTGDDGDTASLADRYVVPPLSILDSRQGYWKTRKDKWNSSLASLKGRGANLMGQDIKNIYNGTVVTQATSEFDPVLAEISYLWFNVAGGSILDPFCGGSVRGIMAVRTGHDYLGFDIRPEQVEANYKQLGPAFKDTVRWICDDSTNLLNHTNGQTFDMIFSCPPYFDLEKYSDNPNDLSNMTYEQFVAAYRTIIARAVSALKDDRFAVFVIGDIRDKKSGAYRDFITDTKRAFIDCGLSLVNDMIYIENVGGSAIRAAGTFNAGRKVVKTHQNVLVFYKGDLHNVKNHFPAITQPGDFEAYFAASESGEKHEDYDGIPLENNETQP